MSLSKRLQRLTILSAGLLLLLPALVLAQEPKTKELPPNAPAVLWQEPTDIASRDLFLGPGGPEMKPDITNVTFVKAETGGYSTKYRVRDGAGRTWVAKVSSEARPETAAVRLVWAAGYVTEVNYLAPCVHIKGAPPPPSKNRCAGDGYKDVRFEARPKNVKRLAEWPWKSNPFAGTKELNGLIVLMGLINNWDMKDSNNQILQVTRDDGSVELHYIVSDLGATFGKTGGFLSRSRNDPEDYVKTRFIKGVENGFVRFAYGGKQGELFDTIPVAEAKWIGNLLSQLSDQQLQDTFRAANFKPEEIQMLTQAVRAKINELVELPG